MFRTLLPLVLISCLRVDRPGDETDADTDADSDADSDSDADLDSVFALQQGSIDEGSTVSFRNLVVVGGNNAGTFVQAPEGGPYSGVWVYYDGNRPDPLPALGTRVSFSGTYQEYQDSASTDTLTQVTLTPGSWNTSGTATAIASVIDPSELAAVPEVWEGVLITVERTAGPLTASSDSTPGRFEVQSGIVVQDWFYDWTPDYGTLGSGDSFDAITGVLDYRVGTYRVLPRRASDLELR